MLKSLLLITSMSATAFGPRFAAAEMVRELGACESEFIDHVLGAREGKGSGQLFPPGGDVSAPSSDGSETTPAVSGYSSGARDLLYSEENQRFMEEKQQQFWDFVDRWDAREKNRDPFAILEEARAKQASTKPGFRDRLKQVGRSLRDLLPGAPKKPAKSPEIAGTPEGSASTSSENLTTSNAVPKRVRRKPGFVVSKQILRRTLKAQQTSNLSLEILLAQHRASGLTESAAKLASDRIRDTLVEAGQLVRQGRLTSAIAIMADPLMLEGSLFSFNASRPLIEFSPASLKSTRAFARHALDNYRVMPSVSVAKGVITIPLEPRDTGSATSLRMAREEWIRVSAEELAHAAQMLRTWSDPHDRFLSQMMSAENSVVRSLVALEVERENDENAKRSAKPRPNFNNYEADVYAFLIETFGVRFIPNWFGIESGYSVRRLIDEELTARGVPGREWPEVNSSLLQN